jgi:hypothetical protein
LGSIVVNLSKHLTGLGRNGGKETGTRIEVTATGHRQYRPPTRIKHHDKYRSVALRKWLVRESSEPISSFPVLADISDRYSGDGPFRNEKTSAHIRSDPRGKNVPR